MKIVYQIGIQNSYNYRPEIGVLPMSECSMLPLSIREISNPRLGAVLRGSRTRRGLLVHGGIPGRGPAYEQPHKNTLPPLPLIHELPSKLRRDAQVPQMRTRMALDPHYHADRELLASNYFIDGRNRTYLTTLQMFTNIWPMKKEIPQATNKFSPGSPCLYPLRDFSYYQGANLPQESAHTHTSLPHTRQLNHLLYVIGRSQRPQKSLRNALGFDFRAIIPHNLTLAPTHPFSLFGQLCNAYKGINNSFIYESVFESQSSPSTNKQLNSSFCRAVTLQEAPIRGQLSHENRPSKQAIQRPKRAVMETRGQDRRDGSGDPLRGETSRPGIPHYALNRLSERSQIHAMGMDRRKDGHEKRSAGQIPQALREAL